MSIQYALLALLSDEAKFGLQLKTDFERHTGEIWPLNVGQVYATLRRSERDGLVAASEDGEAQPGKNLFRLAEKGRQKLHDWLEKPPNSSTPPRDELVIKVLTALSMTDIDLPQLIQQHRRPLLETMRDMTRLRNDGDELALLMVADAEIFRLEAAVRWLDSVETRLKQSDYQPPTRTTSIGEAETAAAPTEPTDIQKVAR